MRKISLLFLTLLMAIAGYAQETATATWVASEQGYGNNEAVESFTIGESVTATTDKGGGSNAPAYYNTGTALRLYWGNTLTLECEKGITKIVMTYDSGYSSNFTVEPTDENFETTGTWEGSATKVTFTRGSTSGHVRIQKIEVTYITDGEMPPVDPLTLLHASPAQGKVKALSTIELTFGDLEVSAAEDALITLTRDGEEIAEMFAYTDGEENKIVFIEDIEGARFTDAGEYAVAVPAGAITAGGQAVGAFTLNYNIAGKQVLEGNPFTWIASQQGYDNAESLGEENLIDGFKMVFGIGENTNNEPKYYETDATVRLYKGNTLTLTGKDIEKVVFSYVSGNAGVVSSSTGDIANDEEALTLTWEGLSDEIVFTNSLEGNTQWRFTQMEVTYKEETTPPAPSEAEIIEMCSITPATGVVESLSEFTLSYGGLALTALEDADVTLTLQDSETIVANGMMEVNEDGKSINISLESPVNGAGAYQLNIPGNAITAAGVTLTDPQSFKYTIQGEEYTIDPAEGEVESLSSFTITFNNYMVEVNGDEAGATLVNTTTGQEVEAKNVYDIAGKKVFIEFDEVTAPGDYELVVMDGCIKKLAGGTFLPELTFHYTIAGEPVVEPQIITLPEGVTAEIYKFKGYDTEFKEEKTAEVMVGIDGQDVYIQGLSISFPVEGWAKGTLDGNTLSIPQTYLGDYEIWGMALDISISPCTFIYDTEAGTFTSEEGFHITSELGGEADFFTDVVLTRWGEVLPATPATPEITEFVDNGSYGYYVSMNIPAVDVDGNELLTSLLSYQIFYEVGGEQHPFVFTTDKYTELSEDMETIPYNFTDSYDIGKAGWQLYLNDDAVTTWDKVGVKSIYTGGGETRESEMFWFTLKSETPLVIEDGQYINEYTNNDGNAASGYVTIRVDGSNIYVKGLSSYLPDTEVKGTLIGNTVTFAAQTVGNYGSYFTVNFLQQGQTVSFTYDEEEQKFTSDDLVYTWFQYQGSAYYESYYSKPVFRKVKEMAGTPATPSIFGLTNSASYGWYVDFNVPVVDTNGNGMVSDKLSFQFFTDINKDVQPLVFTTGAHMYLDEDMTVVAYDFTDDYDFENGRIYFNEDYSEAWNKLGLQSFYTGGGESHASEVFWFDIKDYVSTAINGVQAGAEEGTSYFDTMGRRTDAQAKGLLIQQVRQADGTVTTRKMVRK